MLHDKVAHLLPTRRRAYSLLSHAAARSSAELGTRLPGASGRGRSMEVPCAARFSMNRVRARPGQDNRHAEPAFRGLTTSTPVGQV